MGRGKRNPTVHEQFTEVEHQDGTKGTTLKVFRNPRVRCIHCNKEMARNATHQGMHLKKCVPYRVFAPDATEDSFDISDNSREASRDDGDEGSSMDTAGHSPPPPPGPSQAASSPDRRRLIAKLPYPLLNLDLGARRKESTGTDETTGVKAEIRSATATSQRQNEGGNSVLQAAVAGNANSAPHTPQQYQQAPAGVDPSLSLQELLRMFSENVRVTEAEIRELEEKLLEARERLAKHKMLEEGTRGLVKVNEGLKK